MGYAIIRTQKLKSGQAVRRSLLHAYREQETPNADPSKTPDNTHDGASDVGEALARFNARLPEKVRKNAVLVVEYLVTGTPETMHGKTRTEQDAYFLGALDWLKAKHGADNVVCAGIHRDETTPHMYAYVVPIDERGKLNCRAFLGGAKALSELQTDFAQQVGRLHGLERGVPRSKARHVPIREYYTRVNEAFQPLPEVKTPAPAKPRPAPEKPGLFAGKQAKEEWEQDYAKWERQQEAAAAQHQKRQAEVKAQRDAAVETAKRLQAQAKEAEALKASEARLKQSNGRALAKVATLEAQTRKLLEVAQLFTPEEIRAAQERKQQQVAQKAKEAAEAAKRAKVADEYQRRVKSLSEGLKTAGVAYTFATHAVEALRKANGDPSKVVWDAVEAETVKDAISKHGQAPGVVLDAVARLSPGRADPASHAELAQAIQQAAPALAARYQSREQSGPRLGR
jgi:hypothetical protein